MFHKNNLIKTNMIYPNTKSILTMMDKTNENCAKYRSICDIINLIQDCPYEIEWLANIIFMFVIEHDIDYYNENDDLKDKWIDELMNMLDFNLERIYNIKLDEYMNLNINIKRAFESSNLIKMINYINLFKDIANRNLYDNITVRLYSKYDDSILFVNDLKVYEIISKEFVNIESLCNNALDMNLFNINRFEYIVFNIYSGHIFKTTFPFKFEDGGIINEI